jgi:hypothetical protein
MVPAGLVVAALLLAGCSSGPVTSKLSPAATSIAPSTASSIAISPVASAAPSIPTLPSPAASSATPGGCPVPNGGECRGPLAAGTYSTVTFGPTITYTVPAGWANVEDLPGNFSLLPPGGTVAGINAGTSDFIGVYTSVAADGSDCTAQPAQGVGLSASAIAQALATRPGLASTAPEATTVGGLKGLVLDVKLKKGGTKQACPGGVPHVALIVGVSPSDLEHANRWCLHPPSLFPQHGQRVLAIEIDDSTGGKHLDGYDVVVRSLKFGLT